MKKHYSLTKYGATTAILVLLLAACGPDDNGGEGAGDGGGLERLTYGISDEPAEFAPAGTTNVVAFTLNSLLHAGLMKYDDNAEVIPHLAESVETDDNQVYDITLREELEFADGTPLTAEEVAESFEYLSDPDGPGATNAGVLQIEEIEVHSDTELTFTLDEANSAFKQYLAVPSMAVYHSEDLENAVDSWEGAGPFQIEEYTEGQSLLLSKNENYVGADNVALQEVELVFYPDGTARTNALISGEVDLIDYVPWEQFDTIEADDDLVLDSQNGPFMYLMFNTEEGAPFADPQLRQAIAYAVDRQNTVDAAFDGQGEPVHGVTADEDDPAYDPEWEEMYEEDLDYARELIEESGFDLDEEITFLANSQYVFHEDNALPVLADLEELGFNVNFESPDWATRVDAMTAGEYDLGVNGTVGRVSDLGYLASFVDGPNTATKSWDYQNPELASLISEGMAAESDEEKKELFDEARELFYEDPPFVMLNLRGQAHAYTTDVEGFSTLPGFESFYSGYSIENIE